MKTKLKLCLSLVMVMFLTGCGSTNATTPVKSTGSTYQKITAQEAQVRMKENPKAIVLDVRTKEEYAAGHIPKAICVPNETIDKTPPAELPDKKAEILVYCRSGNRSRQAANKLIAMGYTSVFDFGGIGDWPGEIVK